MQTRIIQGTEAKSIGQQEKWSLLSPFLRRYGKEALAYATLQQGMEYFVSLTGYLAFTSVTHPVFARQGRRMVLSDPICAEADLPRLLREFLDFAPQAAFVVISERCAAVLRELGFKANCIGYEPELQWFEPLPGARSANIVVTLRGTANPELQYVVGNHFDSVKEGPGSDDNTSSTTALLEVARVMARRPQPATIRFVLAIRDVRA